MIDNDTIPTPRILDRVDALFGKNNYTEAGRLLEYWKTEAIALGDTRGELSMQNELVGFYRKTGEREKALAAADRALALVSELEQDHLASGGTVLLNCATAYKAFGKADSALPLYRRAEAIYKQTLPEGDPRFGGLYNNMALALADLGEWQAAEEACFAALAVMQKQPRGDAEAAITYINLAHLYEDCGKDGIADCLKKAYDHLVSDKLPHDGYYAFVLEKCAPSFGYFGNDAICEQFKKEAEAIYAGS